MADPQTEKQTDSKLTSVLTKERIWKDLKFKRKR